MEPLSPSPTAPAPDESLRALMTQGFEHQRARRLVEAERCYAEVLGKNPEHAEALHHLGLVRHQQGQSDVAVDLIRKAIALNPRTPRFFFNLSTILRKLGRAAEAEQAMASASTLVAEDADGCFGTAQRLAQANQPREAEHYLRLALRRDPNHTAAQIELGALLVKEQKWAKALGCVDAVLAREPDHAEALAQRGVTLGALGRIGEAKTTLERALQLNPYSFNALVGWGEWLQRAGRMQQAIAPLQQALTQQPAHAHLQFCLANSFAAAGRLGEAEAAFRKSMATHPRKGMVLNNLADVLFRQHRLQEAADVCKEAIAFNPNLAEAHATLGNIQSTGGQTELAEKSYLRALEVNPNLPTVHNNLGGLRLKQLNFAEARVSFEKAVQLQPSFVEAHSNVLYLLTYVDPGSDTSFQAHAEFGRRHSDPVARPATYANSRDPDRRLRIGFVSPDFRLHPVSTFIEALFKHHDAGRYEYTAYSDCLAPDAMTARLQTQVERWRKVSGMSHDEIAEQVRQDEIDILVDLTGHMANHRLMVFARKPAPVQVGYMGYLNTTGMHAIDYWLADNWVNPPETERLHTETIWRLPGCFVCYTPPANAPEVAPLPADKNGFVTFGMFNNACKAQPAALDIWAELLLRVPAARFAAKSIQFADPAMREHFIAPFVKRGVDRTRLTVLGPSEKVGYLADFGTIDIALDPIPDNGNTTTHDTLWMGVPVVTLKGNACVSRAGYSILANLGHEEWVAESPQQYVDIAATLAADLPRLRDLRRTLRPRMAASPLLDGASFARELDAAWRGMWRKWCGNA
jgi:protein O-GlcNAc transferase